MTDIESVLSRELPVVADRLDVPGGDLPAVLTRAGRRQRQRRRLQGASLTLVAAMVAGAMAAQLRPEGDRQVDVSTGIELQRGETGVVWRHGDTSNALDQVTTQAVGGDLYALSTAPGPADPSSRTPAPRVLYTSADGVEWTPVDPAGGASFLADLSAKGDRLYAVGTTTASVVTTSGKPVADLAVHWTEDAARTWHRTMLQVDLAGIAAKATTVQVGALSIAAGERGVVAVAGVTAQLDLGKVLPAGIGAPNGWALSGTGVDILGAGSSCPPGTGGRPSGPNPLPTTVATVAGGPSGPGQRFAAPCYTSDGTPVVVSPQEAQGVERSFTWVDLGITGDLLRAVQGIPLTFWSADGESFERVDAPLGRLGSVHVASTSDGFTMVGQQAFPGGADAVVLRSTDGRRWSAAAEPAGQFAPMVVGQVSGVVAMLGTSETGPTVATFAGGTWRTGDLSGLVGARGGEEGGAHLVAAGVGPLGVVAVLQVRSDHHLLFSPDGLTWSSDPLADLVDGPVARVGNVTVTDSRIIVTAIPPSAGNAPPEHATVLIGTV